MERRRVGGAAGGVLSDAAVEPGDVIGDVTLLRSFQAALAASGVPLAWFVDVGVDHPAFASLQTAAAAGEVDVDPTDLHACRLPAADRRRHGIGERCTLADSPDGTPRQAVP